MFARRSFALVLAVLIATIAASLGTRVAQAGGGCHEPLTDAHGASVDLEGACFLPAVLRVDEGATIVFTNRDPLPHTVTGVGRASGSSSAWGSFDELQQGQSATYTFASSGVYPYYCLFHPSMAGAIVVGDGIPSSAVVDASASGDASSATRDTVGAARSTNQSSLPGGDGLPARLALFAAAIVIAAAALSLIARRRSRAV